LRLRLKGNSRGIIQLIAGDPWVRAWYALERLGVFRFDGAERTCG